ncbi:MAG: carboxymuconolactone decarboxylase family protein [Luteibaculaceae bacterium]
METLITNPLQEAGIPTTESALIQYLQQTDYRFGRDLKVSFQNTLKSEHLTEREIVLLGLALAANAKNKALISFFNEKATALALDEKEIAEAYSIASLLSINNVLYRFRHFVHKDSYEQKPARVRMNIMAQPVLGAELFELISLAVSAVNGCEACVNSHEESVLKHGGTEDRIFDAVRLASVFTGVDKLV